MVHRQWCSVNDTNDLEKSRSWTFDFWDRPSGQWAKLDFWPWRFARWSGDLPRRSKIQDHPLFLPFLTGAPLQHACAFPYVMIFKLSGFCIRELLMNLLCNKTKTRWRRHTGSGATGESNKDGSYKRRRAEAEGFQRWIIIQTRPCWEISQGSSWYTFCIQEGGCNALHVLFWFRLWIP